MRERGRLVRSVTAASLLCVLSLLLYFCTDISCMLSTCVCLPYNGLLLLLLTPFCCFFGCCARSQSLTSETHLLSVIICIVHLHFTIILITGITGSITDLAVSLNFVFLVSYHEQAEIDSSNTRHTTMQLPIAKACFCLIITAANDISSATFLGFLLASFS